MFSLNSSDSVNNTTCLECIVLDSGRSQDVIRWLWLWLVQRYKRFQVSDRSMLPVLKPGDEVLVDRSAYGDTGKVPANQGSPQPNDIVVVDHPQRPGFRLVKRIVPMPETAIAAANSGYWVEGDNAPVSTDSRSFGPVPPHCLVGKVVCIFREPDR
ncbi:MAG: S26 family signal peptidase [Cyanothece sp. SIO2G6]|nr:S26 family signal peptidase [Cyanothece sp. SIO2G6]